MGSSPTLTKNFLCWFFGLCDTFFRKIFNVCKGSPFIFSYFAKDRLCSKTPKGPLFHFSALCDLPEANKISIKIQKKFGKNTKKIRIFFQFFSHAGTVEENTCYIFFSPDHRPHKERSTSYRISMGLPILQEESVAVRLTEGSLLGWIRLRGSNAVSRTEGPLLGLTQLRGSSAVSRTDGPLLGLPQLRGFSAVSRTEGPVLS